MKNVKNRLCVYIYSLLYVCLHLGTGSFTFTFLQWLIFRHFYLCLWLHRLKKHAMIMTLNAENKMQVKWSVTAGNKVRAHLFSHSCCCCCCCCLSAAEKSLVSVSLPENTVDSPLLLCSCSACHYSSLFVRTNFSFRLRTFLDCCEMMQVKCIQNTSTGAGPVCEL